VGQVADHFDEIVRGLDKKPAIIGHSFGGPARADPGRTRTLRRHGGHRPCSLPWRAAASVLGAEVGMARSRQSGQSQPRDPAHLRSVSLGFANAVSEEEAQELYDTFAVPAAGAPLFQAATANLNPWTEVKVDTENPERGPLLILSGEKDNTVPWSIANASFHQQQRNIGVTEIVEMPNRGHALTIDSAWREVADTALTLVRRYV